MHLSSSLLSKLNFIKRHALKTGINFDGIGYFYWGIFIKILSKPKITSSNLDVSASKSREIRGPEFNLWWG